MPGRVSEEFRSLAQVANRLSSLLTSACYSLTAHCENQHTSRKFSYTAWKIGHHHSLTHSSPSFPHLFIIPLINTHQVLAVSLVPDQHCSRRLATSNFCTPKDKPSFLDCPGGSMAILCPIFFSWGQRNRLIFTGLHNYWT